MYSLRSPTRPAGVPIEVEEGDFEALGQESTDRALAIAIRELLDVLQLPELVEEQSAESVSG